MEAALAAEQAALQAQAVAEAERAAQEQRLAAATALVGTRKGELGRWAAQTYRHGGSTQGVMGFMTLLESDSTDDLGQRVQMLDTVGGWRGTVVDTVEEAEAVQRDATQKAAAASTRADLAAAEAVTARAQADAALAEQQGKVALFGAILAKVTVDAQAAGDKTEEMARVRAEAEQRRLALEAARFKDNRVTGPVGDCLGKPTEAYANGMIPPDALCPLWAAPGHRLRADAAHAFNQLSQAYAAQFGTPVCVTDSYRTFDGQVAVSGRQARPGRRPRHQQPRLGHRGRPVRRDPDLRHRPAPVDAPQRPPARLVPPELGRSRAAASPSRGTGSTAAETGLPTGASGPASARMTGGG